jgi:hypothetical protein
MDRAISQVEVNNLLAKANIPYMKLNDIKIHITGHIRQPGFTNKAKDILNTTSPEYIWAHETAPGIIWLWSEQTPDIREQWLSNPQDQWQNFVPSPPSSPIGFSESASPANPFGNYTPGTGAVSLPPPTSSATTSSFLYGLGPSSGSIPPNAAAPSTLAPDSGPFSVPNSPTRTPSQLSPPGFSSGGYRKRKTRKTRRKSSRRGRSRSRHIRRKKTHHRRHRR